MPIPKLITAFLSLSFYSEVLSRSLRAEPQDAPADLPTRRLTGPEGMEFQVNTNALGAQTAPSIATLSDDRFVIAWESEDLDGSGKGIFAKLYATDGIPYGSEYSSEFQVNNDALGDQFSPSVAGLNEGFVITWTSEGQSESVFSFFGKCYDENGFESGQEFLINTPAAFNANWRTCDVAGLVDGGFVVVWSSAGDDEGDIFLQRYASSCEAEGSAVQVSTYLGAPQVAPSVTKFPDGGYLVTWGSWGQDGSIFGAYGQRYFFNGTRYGNEFRINTYTAGDQGAAVIAAFGDGKYTAAWSSNHNQDNGNDDGNHFGDYATGIFGQRYLADNLYDGEEFLVNTYIQGEQAGPAIAAFPSGESIILWNSNGNGQNGQDGSDFGVFGQWYFSNGTRKGIEFQVNTYTDGAQKDVAITSFSHGGSVTVWVSDGQDGSGYGIFGQRFDTDGNKIALPSRFQINVDSSGNQHYPAIATFSDGGFVVVWQNDDKSGIFGQRYLANGTKNDDEFWIGQGMHPAVTALNNGGFITIWSSGFWQSEIFAQRYTTAGINDGGTFQVSTYNSDSYFKMSPCMTILHNDIFVVAWMSYEPQSENAVYGGNIYGQLYFQNGTQYGVEFRANTYNASDQINPAITTLSNGQFVVVWQNGEEGRGIFGQRYEAMGAKNGAEFQLSTADGRQPSIAALVDGGYVAVWMNYKQFGNEEAFDIVAQRYTANGARVGIEFQVDTPTEGVRVDPTVVSLADTGFIVIWFGGGISGQRYTVNGTRSSAEFAVSTNEAQYNGDWYGTDPIAALAVLPDGGFIATWSGVDTEYCYDHLEFCGNIFGQRFDANGNKIALISTATPSESPTEWPTLMPSGKPSGYPSSMPSRRPTNLPSGQPSGRPTLRPSQKPIALPSGQPSSMPSRRPTPLPSRVPSSFPSAYPTLSPSRIPTSFPSAQPSVSPTSPPTFSPSHKPTVFPTWIPTLSPSACPTYSPSWPPTFLPSSHEPSFFPTRFPTFLPSGQPSSFPSRRPTGLPSNQPNSWPTSFPSWEPTTSQPTLRLGSSRSSSSSISMSELIGFSAGGFVVFLLLAASFRWLFKYFQQKVSKKNNAYELAPPNAAELGSSHQSSHQSSRRIVPEETLHQSALPIHFTGSGVAHTTQEANSGPRPIEAPVEKTPPKPQPAALSQPLKIDRGDIRLDVQLGKGHYGTVHKAEWADQCMTVAVKSFTGDRLPERIADDVQKEVGIMMRLQHDCLIRFYGLVQDDVGPPMVVMEYGEKGSLYHFLHSREDISSGLRLRIAYELAKGLAYLHHKKILHRDLKSLNVVLDQDYHAKLCDFGLAVLKVHSDSTTKAAPTESFEVAGTSRWMAPESFSHKTALPSRASDVWGLGIIFYEIITREIPYKNARTPEDISRWIVEGVKEEIPEACKERMPGFEAIITRCLVERTQRPKAKTLVADIALLMEAPTMTFFAQVQAEPAAGTNTTASHNPYRKR